METFVDLKKCSEVLECVPADKKARRRSCTLISMGYLLLLFFSSCHSDVGVGASGSTKEGVQAASRLFKSDFERCESVKPIEVGTFWEYQSDGNWKCAWSRLFWGGTAQLQTFVSSTKPVEEYVHVELQTVTGHRGTPTRALFQLVKDEHGSPPAGTTSHATLLNQAAREDGDIYLSEWVMLQPDIVNNIVAMPGDNGHWRTIWGMKTEGDYRIEAYILTDENGHPYWSVHGDNNANATKYGLPNPSSYQEYWRCTNGGPGPTCGSGTSTVPIPQGQWFHMEVFLHRSHGEDGRFWMAIDGQVLWDRWGSNYGAHNRRIDRVALAALYGGIADGGDHSVYQWVDDIEVWDGFPCADPPCHRGVLEASLQ